MFSAKAMAEFRKVAPLPEEVAQRRNALAPIGSVKKKLNFDDTADSFFFEPPILPGLKARLADAESEIGILRKKLADKQNQLDSLQTESLSQQDTIRGLRSDVTMLKVQMAHRDEDHRNQISMNSSLLNISCTDDWRNVAAKYITWFNVAREQFNVAGQIIKEGQLLTRDNKYKLRDAQRVSPVELTDDDIDELNRGSVQDVPGMLDLLSGPDDDLADNGLGAVHNASEPITTTNAYIEISPIRPSTGNETMPLLDESSVMNSALLSTTIDFEKDERIDRLENENILLKERLQLASGRANRALLLTEEKRSLAERVRMLELQLSESVSELEALRAASAKKMFDLVDRDTQSRAVEMTDRIKRMQMRNAQLDAQVSSAISERDILTSNCNKLSEKIASQLDHIAALETEVNSLKQIISENSEQLRCAQERIDSELEKTEDQRRRCEQANARIASMEIDLIAARSSSSNIATSSEPTDAGDTTQIVHMAQNPLQLAHEEYIAEERSRKRKLEEDREAENTGSKRACDADFAKELELMRSRLATSEREKQSAQTILQEFGKKYREVTTVLTGYQIKIRDIADGLFCYVTSIYDTTRKEFVFKYTSESGRMDLLDIGQAAASQGVQWNDLMRRYIGLRQSIPAFLASVTLSLEADRELEIPDDEQDEERTHTFSVLHHD